MLQRVAKVLPFSLDGTLSPVIECQRSFSLSSFLILNLDSDQIVLACGTDLRVSLV